MIIEICPFAPHAMACTDDGAEIIGSEYEQDMRDCNVSGDVQEACEYVRDHIEPRFRIVARNDAGDYENRLATDGELQATCEAIYFESETDFSDRDTCETYLIWEAAANLGDE